MQSEIGIELSEIQLLCIINLPEACIRFSIIKKNPSRLGWEKESNLEADLIFHPKVMKIINVAPT